MSVFSNNTVTALSTDLIAFGYDVATDTITGPSLRVLGSSPNGVTTAKRASLVLRNDAGNAGVYINTDNGTTWVLLQASGSSSFYPDNTPITFGTLTNDQWTIEYDAILTRFATKGTAITAGGATQGTRTYYLATGDRTKNDTNAGVPASGPVQIRTGTSTVTAAAIGGPSGAASVITGATDSTNAGGTGGTTGAASLGSGNALSTLGVSGSTGSATVFTGDSADADSGNVILQTGTAAGTRGSILFNAPTLDTQAQVTSWNVIGGQASALRFLNAGNPLVALDTSTAAGTVRFGNTADFGGTQVAVDFPGMGPITTDGTDFGTRYVLVENFAQRPLLVGDIGLSQANMNFELIGTNASDPLILFAAGGGVVMTTAGAANDQMAIKPSTTLGQTAWADVSWAPNGAPKMKCNVRVAPTGTVASMRCAVGFKLSVAAGAGMIQNATDADQAFFGYSTDGEYTASSVNWVAVIRIAGVSSNIDTGIPVVAGTNYRLAINVNALGVARFYINGDSVAVSGSFLTAAAALLPFAAVQTLVAAAAAKSLTAQRLACSRTLA